MKKIGLLGQGGSPNLGDVAIQDSMIAGIRARIPDAHIVILTSDPSAAKERHGVDATHASRPVGRLGSTTNPGSSSRTRPSLLLRASDRVQRAAAGFVLELRFLKERLHQLRSFDLVVVSGGGQLCDYWGGLPNQPYLLLTWAVMSRIAGVRFAIASVGVDLKTCVSALFLSLACRLAAYVSFRDADSLSEARARRLVRAALVYPDLAYSLPLPPVLPKRSASDTRKRIGISPISRRSWPVSEEVYQAYIENLAKFASHLVDQQYEVVFFVTQVKMDPPAVAAVLEKIESERTRARITVSKSALTADVLAEIDRCDVVFASRLHSIILSHLRRRPVIALSYSKKTASVMAEMEQTGLTVDAARVTVADLSSLLAMVEARYDRLVEQIAANVGNCRLRLGEQYDRLFFPTISAQAYARQQTKA